MTDTEKSKSKPLTIASISLGVTSLLFAAGGFIVTFIPVIGTFLSPLMSFGSPVIALAGIVTGGMALSRRDRAKESSGPMTAGVVLSVLGFLVGFVVAITCGVCNTLCAGAMLTPPPEGQSDEDPLGDLGAELEALGEAAATGTFTSSGFSCNYPSLRRCEEYPTSMYSESTQSDCTVGGGEWIVGSCPAADRIGHCDTAGGFGIRLHEYRDPPPAVAAMHGEPNCVEGGGTWTATP